MAGKCSVLFFIFIVTALSVRIFPAGFELGLYGGAGRASMGTYNDAISAANSSNTQLGMSSNLKNQNIYFAPRNNSRIQFWNYRHILKEHPTASHG
jgi:hypothetical protein